MSGSYEQARAEADLARAAAVDRLRAEGEAVAAALSEENPFLLGRGLTLTFELGKWSLAPDGDPT